MKKQRVWVLSQKKYVILSFLDFESKIITDNQGDIYGFSDVVIQDMVVDSKNPIYVGDIVTGIKNCTSNVFVICERLDSEFIGYLPVEYFRYNQENIAKMHGKENIFIGLSAFVRWDDLKVIGNVYENPELLK